jgi:hypothetical protein
VPSNFFIVVCIRCLGKVFTEQGDRYDIYTTFNEDWFRHSQVDEGGTLTPWPESARELYRPSNGRLSAKLVTTVAEILRPYSRFSRPEPLYFFSSFQVVPQLYLRRKVDPVPDPLLLRKSRSAGN